MAFPNTDTVDARGATFTNEVRLSDQFNIGQLVQTMSNDTGANDAMHLV